MKHDLICTDEAKNYKMLSCWPRKVKILHAFYGRATPNVCQYKTFTTKQRCSYDGVTDFMAKRCNGRTSCFFDASASLFNNFRDPCPGISKYLQVLAKCVWQIWRRTNWVLVISNSWVFSTLFCNDLLLSRVLSVCWTTLKILVFVSPNTDKF